MGPGSHSPVGGSAIKRILACPASVSLAQGTNEIDDESEHAAKGTAVHGLIEESFGRNMDAWQFIGQTIEGYRIDKAMADGAQVFISAVKAAHPDRNQGNFWIERKFHCPTIHPLFFGTSDCVYIETPADGAWVLHIWDYKNGAGVVVEVQDNDQCKYYACGALEDLNLWDRVERFVLHIVQPNAYHPHGSVRDWETTTDDLIVWLEDILTPGIELAMRVGAEMINYDHMVNNQVIDSGKHCQFCPVRFRKCPQLAADMAELEALIMKMNTPGAPALTDAEVGRFLELFDLAKIQASAVNKLAFNRLNNGGKIPGRKLVRAMAHRKWKDTVGVADGTGHDVEMPVQEAAQLAFGEAAFEPRSLKSPAEIDKLALGGAFTARAAQKPDAGLTIAPTSDKRAEVSPETKLAFQPVAQQRPAADTPAAPAIEAKRRVPHLTVVN